MPLTIDSLLSTPRLFGVDVNPSLKHYRAIVSPDMKWAVWVWANVGPNADVYIAPLDRSELPKKLTDFHEDTSVISWTENSRYVVVAHDYDGDERLRLYKVDVATGEVFPLTEEHPSYYIGGGQITPDDKYLIYGANYNFDTGEELESTILYRHDLATGEKLALAATEKPAYMCPLMNANGTHILYRKSDRSPQGDQIWIVDIEGREDKEILNFGDAVKVSASWHPNGEDVLFLTEAGTYRKAGMYHGADGTTEWLIDDPARNIEDIYIPRGSSLAVVEEVIDAQNKASLFDLESKKEVKFSHFQTLIPLAQIKDGVWLSQYYNSTAPADLVITTSSEILGSLTDMWKTIDYMSADLSKAENYSWQSVDGQRIQGWLYQPTGPVQGTIVLVHGGPTAHSEDMFDVDIQYFVSQGFNVLDPNYRGSTGFGLPFQAAIKKDGWGGKEQNDIEEGIKSLIKDGIAEEGKIGITGTSYGGYSSWFAITHFPQRYVAAAIPICGMTDLVVDYETTRPDLRGYSEDMMGGTPAQQPEKYWKGSPINFIQNIKGKLLIVQGAKDPNVSPENVRAVEEALQRDHVEYEKLIFADEGHGIAKPGNQKLLLERSAAFFTSAFSRIAE